MQQEHQKRQHPPWSMKIKSKSNIKPAVAHAVETQKREQTTNRN
jgi:hypothetical protein